MSARYVDAPRCGCTGSDVLQQLSQHAGGCVPVLPRPLLSAVSHSRSSLGFPAILHWCWRCACSRVCFSRSLIRHSEAFRTGVWVMPGRHLLDILEQCGHSGCSAPFPARPPSPNSDRRFLSGSGGPVTPPTELLRAPRRVFIGLCCILFGAALAAVRIDSSHVAGERPCAPLDVHAVDVSRRPLYACLCALSSCNSLYFRPPQRYRGCATLYRDSYRAAEAPLPPQSKIHCASLPSLLMPGSQPRDPGRMPCSRRHCHIPGLIAR